MSRHPTFPSVLSLALLAATLAAACESSAPSSPGLDALGPPPLVEATAPFGIPPLSGYLRLTPPGGSSGWRYRVDPITTEPQAWTGVLDAPDSIPYRLEEAGIHTIRVELEGPQGVVVVEERVIVSDPAVDFEIVAQRPIDGLLDFPEGIAIDPEERWLYVGDYRDGRILVLDAATLEVHDSIRVRPHVEGLSITPDGSRLVAVHELPFVSVVKLPSMQLEWESAEFGRFYPIALDERTALLSGRELSLVDLARGQRLAEPEGLDFGHLALDPAGQRVAVANGLSIEIRALPSLAVVQSPPAAGPAELLAFDPAGDRLYAIRGDRFLVVDLATGTVADSLSLGLGCAFCAANPVATFGSGRWIAFERTGAVDVVDTALERPRFRLASRTPVGPGPSGVAARPDSDFLYVLGGPARAIYKLRVRNP